MGKSKIRTLLMSSVMIMLCAAMIVGGTFALWSDNVTVNTHLSAGTLDVQLTRTYLEKYTLNPNTKYMQKTTDINEAPTTDNADIDNIFGITEGELIVPTSYYLARLKLINRGSVAIEYTINIGTKDDSAKELAKQVIVYIGTDDATAEDGVAFGTGKYLATEADGNVNLASIQVESGYLDATTTEKAFWVKIEFVNGTEENGIKNNSAQNKTANFDLLVEATQKTAQATTQE